jgi:predicted N-formylglutamate amidohydrolase
MTLLGKNDPFPYDLINLEGKAPILITCEHAGQSVPESLNKLGMEDEDFNQHYAYDPGVKEASYLLSEMLDAPAILGHYSRKVVDLGRRKNETAFPTIGEGKIIHGNQNLSEEDKEARFKAIYDPYHDKIQELLDHHFLAKGVIPMVISVHSFTPVFHGQHRPWEISCLWVQDERLPRLIMDGLKAKGYVVGDNEPYNMKIVRGTVIDRYADTRKLPNVMVEFRNDLVRKPEDVRKHVTALVETIKPAIGEDWMHSFYDGPETPYDAEVEKAYFANVMRTVREDDIKK